TALLPLPAWPRHWVSCRPAIFSSLHSVEQTNCEGKSSWSDMARNTRDVTIARWHAAGTTISLRDLMLQLMEKALNTKASLPSAQNAGMTISTRFYTQIRFATDWDSILSPREMSLRGLWNAVKRVF